MPIHITVVCDTCKQVAQPAAFESDNETAGDLKCSYEGLGWHLSQREGTHPIVATCPKCARCPHGPEGKTRCSCHQVEWCTACVPLTMTSTGTHTIAGRGTVKVVPSTYEGKVRHGDRVLIDGAMWAVMGIETTRPRSEGIGLVVEPCMASR